MRRIHNENIWDGGKTIQADLDQLIKAKKAVEDFDNLSKPNDETRIFVNSSEAFFNADAAVQKCIISSNGYMAKPSG